MLIPCKHFSFSIFNAVIGSLLFLVLLVVPSQSCLNLFKIYINTIKQYLPNRSSISIFLAVLNRYSLIKHEA